MSPVSVSVIVPTYNASAFIAGALRSVFAQTVRPLEVIVVDDASADETLAVVGEMALDAPVPVRVLKREVNSGGPPQPLNDGIAEAKGELVATLEQDDEMLPGRIERQLAALDRLKDVGLVFGRCRCVREGKEDELSPLPWESVSDLGRTEVEPGLYRIEQADAYAGLVTAMYALTCSTFLFPKAVWAACGGFDPEVRSNCDLAFLQKVSRCRPVGYIDEPVISWRLRDDSLYRQSHKQGRYRDLAFVLRRFDGALLRQPARLKLRERVREEALGAAYAFRECGSPREALRYYLWSVSGGGWSWEALRGLVTLLPRSLVRRVGMRDES